MHPQAAHIINKSVPLVFGIPERMPPVGGRPSKGILPACRPGTGSSAFLRNKTSWLFHNQIFPCIPFIFFSYSRYHIVITRRIPLFFHNLIQARFHSFRKRHFSPVIIFIPMPVFCRCCRGSPGDCPFFPSVCCSAICFPSLCFGGTIIPYPFKSRKYTECTNRLPWFYAYCPIELCFRKHVIIPSNEANRSNRIWKNLNQESSTAWQVFAIMNVSGLIQLPQGRKKQSLSRTAKKHSSAESIRKFLNIPIPKQFPPGTVFNGLQSDSIMQLWGGSCCSRWTLSLEPTSYGDSLYQTFSA